jgi:cytochrome c peroxidase
MRYVFIMGALLLALLGGSASIRPLPPRQHVERIIRYFTKACVDFAHSTDDLSLCIKAIDRSRPSTTQKAKDALKNCRLHYKRISFFLEYFLPQTAWFYNAPAKYEVEEPFMEYEEPHGFQQIEALLFDQNAENNKKNLMEQATVIRESASALPSLVYQFAGTDAQLLESLRIELIRIMTLYITGYDAPRLKTGIAESAESMMALQYVVEEYTDHQEPESRPLSTAIQKAIGYLKTAPSFDSFDRLSFLSDYALPLEYRLGQFIKKEKFSLSSVASLDFSRGTLFQKEIRPPVKSGNKELIMLGRKLFSEKRLSGNNSRSCASCHESGKYYTDQLSNNSTFNGHGRLSRNTPTVLYSAFQSAQFWDGRATSLTEQIRDVLTNSQEMNASIPVAEKELNKDTAYRALFRKAFRYSEQDSITLDRISEAITGFMASLNPLRSPFDQYLRGNKKALSAAQKTGFNLFMGKAQCGTCHFIPFFNGSTPPFFNRSEYEVLGVPASDHFDDRKTDPDEGRYSVFASPYYRGAFKTPTLRNIEKTGPYMHNGKFKSLIKVLEFYNRGGGAGIGMQIPNQTLSPLPLHLKTEEMKAIILFLNSLTDQHLN